MTILLSARQAFRFFGEQREIKRRFVYGEQGRSFGHFLFDGGGWGLLLILLRNVAYVVMYSFVACSIQYGFLLDGTGFSCACGGATRLSFLFRKYLLTAYCGFSVNLVVGKFLGVRNEASTLGSFELR